MILAGWDSRVVLAEIRRRTAWRSPFFVSYAWSPDITKAGYPEVVRIGPNSDMLTSAFAPFMTRRGYTRVAIVAENTPYGQGLGETISARPRSRASTSPRRFPRGSHDLRPSSSACSATSRTRSWSPPTSRPARTLAITQARGAGYKKDIVLGWDYVDEAFWKATGKHGVGVIWPTFSAPKLRLTDTGTAFKQRFTKRYKHAPLIYQALTWDQLNAWKWAADTAGSVAPAAVVPMLPRIDMEGTLGRITLSSQPKSVHYNQWEGVKVYFDQAPKAGATDATAKVLAGIKGSGP